MEYHKPTMRVLNILEIIDIYSDGITQSEISDILNIPKSTISPILKTLCDKNYIRLKDKKYKISFKAFQLGLSYAGKLSALEVLQKEMQNIVDQVQEICQLGILSDQNVFYLLKVNSKSPIEIVSEVGKRIPAYATALGKAIFMEMEDQEIKSLYQGIKWIRYTEHTIGSLPLLLEEIRSFRQQGYATDKEESMDGIECVAVPIHFEDQIFALSVTFPTFRSNDKKRNKIIALLQQKKKLMEEIFSIQGNHFQSP